MILHETKCVFSFCFQQSLSESLGVRGIPALFILNKDGDVVQVSGREKVSSMAAEGKVGMNWN